MFKVHCGWTAKGNDRWRTFGTLEEARQFCSMVFARRGIVLTIVAK